MTESLESNRCPHGKRSDDYCCWCEAIHGLDAIARKVLAYKPPPKSKAGKARKRRARKIANAVS